MRAINKHQGMEFHCLLTQQRFKGARIISNAAKVDLSTACFVLTYNRVAYKASNTDQLFTSIAQFEFEGLNTMRKATIASTRSCIRM